MKAIFAAYKGSAWVNADALFAKKEGTPRPPAKQITITPSSKPNSVAEVPLSPAQTEALQRMQQKLEIARYSPRTINTYLNATKKFFQHFPAKHPNDIRTEDIERYQHHMASERKVSNSYLNQVVNAVRYYYKDVLGDAHRVKFIERPRGDRKLPNVLSEEEVTAILRAVGNLKHQCILMLIYSAGLRLGELINLKRSDIRSSAGAEREGRTASLCSVLKYSSDWTAIWWSTGLLSFSSRAKAVVHTRTPVSRPFSGGPRTMRVSPLQQPCIRSATPSPPIFWKREPTCAIFKPC